MNNLQTKQDDLSAKQPVHYYHIWRNRFFLYKEDSTRKGGTV